jgi:hypothetical protein
MKILCAALCIAAVTTSDLVPESEWEGWTGMAPSVELAVTKMSASAQMAVDMSKGASVLDKVRALRAYALAARENAVMLMRQDPKSAALCKFIVAYGKKGKSTDNIVTKYSEVMGALRQKYHGKGMNNYLLKHLDQAVVFGKGAVSRQKTSSHTYMALEHRHLGLHSTPTYFGRLRVRLAPFLSVKAKVDQQSKNADALAAAAWLAKGTKKKYKSFLGKVVEAWNAKRANHFKAVASRAKGAIRKVFNKAKNAGMKKMDLVVPQPPAGMKASKAAQARIPFKDKTAGQLVKEAAANAKAWAKKEKAQVGTKGVVEDMETKARKAAAKKIKDQAKERAAKPEKKIKAAAKEKKAKKAIQKIMSFKGVAP